MGLIMAQRKLPDDALVHKLLQEHSKEEVADLFDAAIERWLDKQLAKFGLWTVRGLMAIAIAGVTWFWFHTGGFKS